ncbi:hypothetical protein [Streptomyces griseorubiginosus]|uniref:hypothetical protein n=1 Tax=Streptomyces griseorubiginosus TaxID=67304 RepID=UPI00341B8367
MTCSGRLQFGAGLLGRQPHGAQVPAQCRTEDPDPVGEQQRLGAGEFESAVGPVVRQQRE